MVQHSFPFQDVIVAVFRAFGYFLYLQTIAESEIGKKNHEEDLKQNRRDRPTFNKMFGNYDKCEFSNFFLFQQAKMIISVFGNMDDSRLQFGCQSFIILLAVRYRSIKKRRTNFWLACRH